MRETESERERENQCVMGDNKRSLFAWVIYKIIVLLHDATATTASSSMAAISTFMNKT